MAVTIHKQEIHYGTVEITDRIGVQILSIGLDGQGVPCAWFSFTGRGGYGVTLIQSVPTGVEFVPCGPYVGTFVTTDGYVFHCYAQRVQR